MGMPAEDNDEWLEAVMQLERNMIFDIPKFQEENPNYTFYNPVLDFHIPAELRVKKFAVNLDSDDIKHIITRVKLAREYLCAKEIEVRQKLDEIKEKYENAE